MSATHHHHHQHHHAGDSSTDVTDWSKALILLGLGGYFAWLIFSGNLSNYINLRYAWLAGLATVIFFLLGAVNLYGCFKPRPCQHHHYLIGRDILMIVAFPLLLALLIPSRSLGIEAITGGISLNPVGVQGIAAFSRSPLDRNILDWLRQFSRAPTPAAFNNEPVDVIGFVYREPDFAADDFMISRFTMSCCVADAYPIGMPSRFAGASAFPAGQWARVQGELTASDFGGEFLPVLIATSLEPVDEPEQPYLYP